MLHHYGRILTAIDDSYKSKLVFEEEASITLYGSARLLLTHVIDTCTFQSAATFDTYIYEKFKQGTKDVLNDYEQQAREKGLTKVKQVIEFGNPKTLLARDIPDKEKVGLIIVGATGLNAFERLLIGSLSEYVMRRAEIDLLVVRDSEKTF